MALKLNLLNYNCIRKMHTNASNHSHMVLVALNNRLYKDFSVTGVPFKRSILGVADSIPVFFTSGTVEFTLSFTPDTGEFPVSVSGEFLVVGISSERKNRDNSSGGEEEEP